MLSNREKQALQLAANGLRVVDIAREMRVSVRTVEAHLSSARDKLEASNTTQATSKAIRSGLILSLALIVTVNAISLNYNLEMRRHTRDHRITREIRRNEI